VCALLSGAARQLIWGLPVVVRELRRWHRTALQIPDPKIRADALSALERKRGNTHGAALFWVIPRTRNRHLLALLVTYQVMWDFLDCVSESGAGAGQDNGYQLHQALVDALDPSRPLGDYYALHPWNEDGGYLHALVQACRSYCRELPSIEEVRPTLLREAHRAGVQAINHELNPLKREAALKQWAAREYPGRKDVTWFELTGAAGAGLAIYALFVLAAEPGCSDTDAERVYEAYFPWAGAVATMLDSFVDEGEDREHGDHCYVAYYGTSARASAGIARLVERCTRETHSLANSEGHNLIVACMVAMYLSKDSARSEQLREATEALLNAGGELTRFLLPVLRLWRVLNAQRST
jgi:tetraprenyl-beta-curcumene synthase